MKPAARGACAFTLVELLLALVMTSVLASAIYGVFYTSMEAWRRGTDESRLSFEGGFLCDFIAKDLRGALELDVEEMPAFAADGPSMEFFTAAARTGEVAWPVRRVRYYLEKAVEADRGTLHLEVTPYAGTVPLVEEAAREVLADRIHSFSLRYHTRSGWEDRWEGEGLPPAVEITIEIGSDDGRTKRTFSTAVDLASQVQRGPRE